MEDDVTPKTLQTFHQLSQRNLHMDQTLISASGSGLGHPGKEIPHFPRAMPGGE